VPMSLDKPLRSEVFQFLGARRRGTGPFRYAERDARLSLPEAIRLGVTARRFQFEVEILVRARWQGIPIREAPVGVSYTPDGRRISHFRPFVDFCRNTETFSRLIFLRVLRPVIGRHIPEGHS